MSEGPFQLGSRTWPGLSKLIEEAGEVGQVAGKIVANGGDREHWDGTDLIVRMGKEIADLSAATRAFIQLNGYDGGWVLAREQQKYHLFLKWHFDNLPDKPDDRPEPKGWGRIARFFGAGSDDHYQIFWAWRVYPRAMLNTLLVGLLIGAVPGILLFALIR